MLATTLLILYNLGFLVFVVIVATEILICENFNFLTFMVHEILPGDRRTDSG